MLGKICRIFSLINIIVVVALLVISCQFFSFGNETGSLIIRSYSANYVDPSTITADLPINAILDVTYPDASKKTIVTNDLGYYDFGIVSVGNYSIQPRYCSPDFKKTFVVTGGNPTMGDVMTPYTGFYYYSLNPNKPFTDSLNIRQSLCKAIDRHAIMSALNADNPLAYTFIPEGLSGPWSIDAHSMNESLAEANALLEDSAHVSVEILYNSSAGHQTVADQAKLRWESLTGGGSTYVSVALNPVSWNALITLRDIDKNFQIARNGWIMDSNNMLNFYKKLDFIETSAFENLLSSAQSKLDASDFDAYEAGIIAINNYLIDNAYVLPLYCYEP